MTVTARSSAPFWASVDDLDSVLVGDDVARALDALGFASFILWSLAGRRYTPLTEVTEAYNTTTTMRSGSGVYPMLLDGKFYNVCGGCECSGCGVTHRTRLKHSPVRWVSDVWVDGRHIDRSQYVLLDHAVLGFLGNGFCNVNCVTVRYTYGTGVPPGGKAAAVKLAEELLKDARGDSCRLPKRVTQISRQGESWTLLDPQDFLDKGRTGIYEIDLLLRALNPTGALLPAKVFNPDIPRGHTFTMAEPPLSVLMQDGDQAVIRGVEARWVTQDKGVIAALKAGRAVWAQLAGTKTSITGPWQLLPDATTPTAYIDLMPKDTHSMTDGTPFELTDGSEVFETGMVRIVT